MVVSLWGAPGWREQGRAGHADVLIFDEFNVPSHEFYAMKIFQDCFYVKLKPISAINNFYQLAFEIEKI